MGLIQGIRGQMASPLPPISHPSRRLGARARESCGSRAKMRALPKGVPEGARIYTCARTPKESCAHTCGPETPKGLKDQLDESCFDLIISYDLADETRRKLSPQGGSPANHS